MKIQAQMRLISVCLHIAVSFLIFEKQIILIGATKLLLAREFIYTCTLLAKSARLSG